MPTVDKPGDEPVVNENMVVNLQILKNISEQNHINSCIDVPKNGCQKNYKNTNKFGYMKTDLRFKHNNKRGMM